MNTLNIRTILAALATVVSLTTALHAQVPNLINYQGRVQSGGVNFNGTGKFKFAISIGTGGSPVTQWSNDGTSSGGSEPTNAVSIPVTNGVYSVLLGDTTIANMTVAVPTAIFNFSTSLYLRVWFDDGVHGSQLLSPDQRIAPTAWAMVASVVANNGVTTNSITDGAVTAAKIANVNIVNPGITASQIANNTITAAQIADGTITSAKIANGAIGAAQITANSITAGQIAANTITANKIAPNSLTAAQLAPGSVDYSELAYNSVHHDIIGAGEVYNANLANGAVDWSKLSISVTTKVTNLNADLLDGLDSTAFVKKVGDTMTGSLSITNTVFNGAGLYGEDSNGSQAIGVSGKSTNGIGVKGQADAANGWGVWGVSANGLAGYFQGNVQVDGTATVQVLTITGGADLAEPFNLSEHRVPKGSVVVIDESSPGKLTLSNRPYDHRVAGIVSGANGVKPGIQLHQEGVMDGEENVALSGRVFVRADTSNGPIKPGDLLTTSRVPGEAMRVTNHAKAQGAIIGKAMGSLNEGSGMVLVLVTLQ